MKNTKKILTQEFYNIGCIALFTLCGALLNNLPAGFGLGIIAGISLDKYMDKEIK